MDILKYTHTFSLQPMLMMKALPIWVDQRLGEWKAFRGNLFLPGPLELTTYKFNSNLVDNHHLKFIWWFI